MLPNTKAIKRVIVTGSSGMIGTALCEALIPLGYDIIPVDFKPNKWNKDLDKKTILVDLREPDKLKNIPHDADIIVHLAANARVYDLVVEPSLARDNFTTTFNTLEFARQHKIPRFIFASSREVYGNSEKLVHSEGDVHVDDCESPYTASKIAGEALVQSYKRCYGINSIIVRFSNVYGKYDESDRLIPLFIRKTLKNEDLVVFGKDKNLDFTFIDDTVAGVVLCVQKFDTAHGNTLNIATGKGVKIVDFAELLLKVLNRKNPIRITDNRPGEVVQYVADISLAKKILGFNPKIGIEEGLQKTLAWYSGRK
jgi:UDP-glucose 4-epimerase